MRERFQQWQEIAQLTARFELTDDDRQQLQALQRLRQVQEAVITLDAMNLASGSA